MNELAITRSESIELTAELAALRARLRPLSTEKIQFRMLECWQRARDFVAEIAVCVETLTERGVPVENMRANTVNLYLRIAEGQILPDLVWLFAERPQNLNRVKNMPLKVQRRIVADSMVEMVVLEVGKDGNAHVTKQKVDLVEASKPVLDLVLGEDNIRSTEQQIKVLTAPKKPPVLPREDIQASHPTEPLTRSTTIRWAESEYETIRHCAARCGVKEAEMIRRLVLQSDAFTRPRIR